MYTSDHKYQFNIHNVSYPFSPSRTQICCKLLTAYLFLHCLFLICFLFDVNPMFPVYTHFTTVVSFIYAHEKMLSSQRFYGVMVSTLDSESSDPSSNLGRTYFFYHYFFISLNGINITLLFSPQSIFFLWQETIIHFVFFHTKWRPLPNFTLRTDSKSK